MDLNSLIYIKKINTLGTFSAAAKALGMPNSNLSLKIKQLEEELGQPLFSRSTRRVSITEFGRKILEEASPVFAVEEKIKSLSQQCVSEPVGTIRVSAPFDIGLYLLREIIPAFVRDYPKVQVHVDLTNAYINLIESGFDLAIRASRAPLDDSEIVAVKLGESDLKLFAHRESPFAQIKNVGQLEGKPILSFGSEVKLSSGQKQETVRSSSQISVRDMAGIKQAVLGLAGIGVLPEFSGSDEISEEHLTKILPKWSAGRATYYALFPKEAALSLKNRAFIEYLKERF